jgi:AhpD family alkylhydroperoxidase
MRPPFAFIDTNGLSPASSATLAAIHAKRGMTMNLERAMAASPALLSAYTQAMELFDSTSLTPLERQIVLQAISIDNDCRYCVAWHTAILFKLGLNESDIAALRGSRPLSDARLEALRWFTVNVSQRRGHITDDALQAFLAQGWTTQQALEVIVGIGAKTMSNYASSLMHVAVDRVVEKYSLQENANA